MNTHKTMIYQRCDEWSTQKNLSRLNLRVNTTQILQNIRL